MGYSIFNSIQQRIDISKAIQNVIIQAFHPSFHGIFGMRADAAFQRGREKREQWERRREESKIQIKHE